MTNDGRAGCADHYSYADQTSMSRAVSLLFERCDCHREAQFSDTVPPTCPQGPNSRRFLVDSVPYCAFEPGSTVETGPDGKIAYSRATSVHQTGSQGQAMLQLDSCLLDSPNLPQLPSERVMDPDGHAPSAPLAAGFRVQRTCLDRQEYAEFQVPSRNNGTITCDQTRKSITHVPRFAFRDKLSTFLRRGVYDFHDNMDNNIWWREDALCVEQLSTLDGQETFDCHWDSTLADLELFIGKLNRSRPPELQLDTVFVNYGLYIVLFGRDPRTLDWSEGYPEYRNMVRLNGITFLHSSSLPHYCSFATSSAQGPVFVHGPSILRCTDSTIDVERYCALIAPPTSSVPSVPWGVRFNVTMEWKKSKGQSGEGSVDDRT